MIEVSNCFGQCYSYHVWTIISDQLLYHLMQIEASGGQALTFGGDVSKEADVNSMIKTVSPTSFL